MADIVKLFGEEPVILWAGVIDGEERSGYGTLSHKYVDSTIQELREHVHEGLQDMGNEVDSITYVVITKGKI